MAANTRSTDLESTSSQYWSIADASQTGLDGGTMTIMTWFKAESLPSAGNTMTLVGKRNGTGDQRSYYFYINNTAGTYTLGLQTDATGAAPIDVQSSSIAFTTATWWFVAVTYTSGTGAIAFYEKAGAGATNTAGTGTGRTSIFNSTSEFDIGRIADGASYFDGLIDEVMFFDAALSQATIDGIKDSCSNTTSLANLISWWKFDNNGNDEKGTNNLTNNNTATFSTDVAFSCAAAFIPSPMIHMMGVTGGLT